RAPCSSPTRADADLALVGGGAVALHLAGAFGPRGGVERVHAGRAVVERADVVAGGGHLGGDEELAAGAVRDAQLVARRSTELIVASRGRGVGVRRPGVGQGRIAAAVQPG